MSDWRGEVDYVPWRYRKVTRGDIVFLLEAETRKAGWVEFGMIDMDCADEGTGESVAELIVTNHNALLEYANQNKDEASRA